MKSLREILPAPASQTTANSPVDESEPTPTPQARSSSVGRRRPQTRVACTPCRRKKSKCDGRRPVCSACTNAGSPQDCEYDADPDISRVAALRKKSEDLQRRVALLEELFHLLALRPEQDSIEILRRMRTTNYQTDLEHLVKFIREGDLLVQAATAGSSSLAKKPLFTPPTELVGTAMYDEIASLFETLQAPPPFSPSPRR
ncbi:hypothetical protein SODALDRAFT_200087 [Sodiomyces alkalinus F11]|uniref:Zn(2)-C6 fungal-type domain-containing protein n=1 Tax=Sodiomyces alkalinus (strain CBS 110278 / VKM F-3762 / F11) TaxID=1314773 RepID=A0A3N2PTC7_SODAK|nr:hypothetical protein SODALDRAFT_200087 [Sodiomyces alkalinus F11]ROT37566.1 hypothetical protein SODALDRAFT_200087 [Sodiomyces alkalinus F11]